MEKRTDDDNDDDDDDDESKGEKKFEEYNKKNITQSHHISTSSCRHANILAMKSSVKCSNQMAGKPKSWPSRLTTDLGIATTKCKIKIKHRHFRNLLAGNGSSGSCSIGSIIMQSVARFSLPHAKWTSRSKSSIIGRHVRSHLAVNGLRKAGCSVCRNKNKAVAKHNHSSTCSTSSRMISLHPLMLYRRDVSYNLFFQWQC